jgi:flagellar basal-body rod protein FlgG
LRPGEIEATGAALDVAIKGDGFFRVRLGDGRDGFTRTGALQLDGAGELIVPVADGWYRLVPNIVVPAGATQVSILPNGVIQYTPRCGDVRATAGRLPLIRFAAAKALRPQGNNLYTQTARSGPPIVCDPGAGGAGVLQQGFLENLD